MKVYIYPADLQGCGMVRLIWAANHLRSQGADIEIIDPTGTKGITGDIYDNPSDPNDPRNGEITSVSIPPDADVLVFQRLLIRQIPDAIPHIRRSGRAVVVDMDDDLTRIDPANPAFRAMHPKHSPDPNRHWGHATRACHSATMVTVSTPALLETYARHGRGRVVENCIPRGFLAIDHWDSDVIGWGGSLHSHPRDMIPLGSSIAQLVRAGHEFHVVGPGGGMRHALGLEADPPATGPVLIQDWPVMLAQTIGVGVAPLADTEFNRAKSWLKPLEMMALGIPWVASPRAEYARLHKLTGHGFLAERPREWLKHLRRLVNDEAFRLDQSAAGREKAADWTIEGRYADKLWSVWEEALRMERSLRGSALRRT